MSVLGGKRLQRGVPILLALGCTAAASAYDANTHLTIVQAAFRLSPAAEARVPSEYRDAFLNDIREADPRDPDCRAHRGPQATLDPAAEAEKLYQELSVPAGREHAYRRAQVMGRYLHYVADCAAPRAIARGKMLPNFFANENFALFREPGRLDLPIGASLREREQRAEWADDDSGAYPAVFRQVVNLTIDALLALPALPGGRNVPDPDVVIFVVNRMDSGLSSRRTTYWTGRSGRFNADVLGRGGVQVLEWAPRAQGEDATVRALLLNNEEGCVSNLTARAGGWSGSIAGGMPPGVLRRVDLKVPPGIRLETVHVTYSPAPCRAADGRADLIRADKRIVINGGGIANPQFGEGSPQTAPASR